MENISIKAAREVLGHVPDHVKWEWANSNVPSPNVIHNQLRYVYDSGVGPDGLAYSAWRAGGI
eukprot:2472823-Karenia_brevis.AAC.1